MSKAKSLRPVADNAAMARSESIRTSPTKLNLVAALIRGKTADQALASLSFCRRRVAQDVKKVLQAAIANAENNHQLRIDLLYVSQATVGKAMVMKRFHTRGRGRSARIEKFFSKLTIVVTEREQQAPVAKTKAEKEAV